MYSLHVYSPAMAKCGPRGPLARFWRPLACAYGSRCRRDRAPMRTCVLQGVWQVGRSAHTCNYGSVFSKVWRFVCPSNKRPAPESTASSSSLSSTMTGSETDGCRMETPRGKGRMVGDCKCMWHREWELDYLVTYNTKIDTCICLKCNSTLDTVKKYTLQRHSEKMHPETNHWSQERRRLLLSSRK